MRWLAVEPYESVRGGRLLNLQAFGFSEQQARFLLHVLIFSGVFIERQFRAFTGITHGQRTKAFLSRLIERRHATAITPGKAHQGRLYHVHYKPLYEAIFEENNRNRRPASMGRYVERLMLLDAVLADQTHHWLGTERDKRAYFDAAFDRDMTFVYPQLAFGEGRARTVRYFPDKLPIGVTREGCRHLFLYLVTRPVPSEFRAFLIRHASLLLAVDEWTIRVLVPRRFWSAVALHRFAIRDTYITRLAPGEAAEFDWYCRARRGLTTDPAPYGRLTLTTAAKRFGTARFRAFERAWEQHGEFALRSVETDFLLEKFRLGRGRIEFVQIPHQYLQLTPLIGVA